jgi:predicted nucleic acid-binding protein
MIELPPPGVSLALDSDVFNDWRYQRPAVLDVIRNYQLEFKALPALTSFTVFEAFIGFEKQAARGGGLTDSQKWAREHTESLVHSCRILPFDESAAEIAAYVFGRLGHAEGNRLRKDVFIASTAIAHRHGLASRNRKDFEVIATLLPTGLKLYLAIWKR